MISQAPSIYESFNARSLTNEELCETFIISDHFQELASPNHTILVGPRGSGKTTLMRMLQVEALDIWNNETAQDYRNSVSFSGVFIPTDRFWKSQFDRLKEQYNTAEDLYRLLTSLFTYHTIEHLATTLYYRTKSNKNGFKKSFLDKSDEAELTTELSSHWKVAPTTKSLRSLIVSITKKKKEISDYLTNSKNSLKPDVTSGDLPTILGSSIKIINLFISQEGEKWCFLFDELELAPEEFIQPLVNSMRGGPADIIFKLSLSPYHRNLSITESSESSMSKQDLSIISLTGSSDAEGLKFSEKLCQNIFEKKGLNKKVDYYFAKPKPIKTQSVFQELSKKDKGFSDYLKSNNIEIKKIPNYTEKDKGPTIRKIKFIANLRNYYRKSDRLASRKTPAEVYAGFKSLCQAMEYNPRMIIGLMNEFAHIAIEGEKIKISDQLKMLSESFNSFKALLETIAIESNNSSFHSIFDLIHAISIEFKEEIIGEKFNPEPKGSITLKGDGNDQYLEAIGFALNSGALIVDRGSDDAFFNQKSLKSARCRISYIFSHKYRLLTQIPRKKELCEILGTKHKVPNEIKVINPTKNKQTEADSKGQMTLL